MRLRRLIVAAVVAAAAAACGAFSASEVPADAGASGADGSADVPGDAGVANPLLDGSDEGAPSGSKCAPHASINLLAGNFDGTANGGATYSIMGTSYGIPMNTAGASAGVMSPGADGTGKALHIHSTGGDYALDALAVDLTGGVCVIVSMFDIEFDTIIAPTAAIETTFAVVGVRSPAFDDCSVAFQYFRAANALGVQSHCGTRDGGGGYNASTTAVPAFPAGFVHVVLTLDLANAVATLAIGSSTRVTLPLGTDQVVGGGRQAYAEIGLSGTGTGFDGTINVDSIDVEAR